MNIEEDFAVVDACLCIANTVPSARRRRRSEGERRFFLSVLARNKQKQTEILREKTSRGVLVIQLRRVVYMCDFDVATSGHSYYKELVRKPGKLQRNKQRSKDLCWKVHDPAQSFVLYSHPLAELLNRHVSIG